MGTIGLPTVTSRTTRAPLVTVEIAGVRRSDASVESIEQTVDARPSEVVVCFPLSHRGDRPARLGDRVTVWLNKWLGGMPVFIGRIVSLPRQFDRGRGPLVQYKAMDLRHFLNDSVCSRSFNEVNRMTGEILERMTTRQIVRAIHDEYVSHQQGISGRSSSDILKLSLASFPDADVGQFECRGEPHGDTLSRLVSQFGDGSYRLRIRYDQGGGATLQCFRMGQGITRSLVAGTLATASEFDQPFGRANVGDGVEDEDYTQIVNDVTVEIPRRVREQAVRLGPAFDVNRLDDLAARMDVAGVTSLPALKDPTYDPARDDFGKRWLIPAVEDVDGAERRLEIASELVQSFDPDDAEAGNAWFAERPNRPFVVVKWSDDTDAVIVHSGVGGVVTNGTTYTITGEETGSDRLVGMTIAAPSGAGTPQTITAQNGNALTVAATGGLSAGAWEITAGTLDDLQVMFDGFSIKDGREVIFNRPLVRKITTAAEEFDRTLLLGKVEVLEATSDESGTELGTSLAVVSNSAVSPFDLSAWATGSKEMYTGPAESGNLITPLAGNAGSADYVDLRSLADLTTALIDSLTGTVWLPVPEPMQTIIKASNLASLLLGMPLNTWKFAQPLYFRDTKPGGGWIVPVAVWLNAGFVSEVPHAAESGRQGGVASFHVKRRTTQDGFAIMDAKNFYQLTGAEVDGRPASWSVALVAGPTTFRDDEEAAEELAERLASQSEEPLRSWTRVLPRVPTHFQVGDLIVENGQTLGNVVRVAYAFPRSGAPPLATIDVATR